MGKFFGQNPYIGCFPSEFFSDWKLEFFSEKIFRRKHPKYDKFIIIGDFSKKYSIDSSYQSEKQNLTVNTLYMDSDKKIFLQKFLKKPNYEPP